MAGPPHETLLRVRYSETDQMGTFYNSRALEWFECGRSAWLRAAGIPYAEIEARGFYCPVIEAHVRYLGRARYDDELRVSTTAVFCGKARLRFDVKIMRADSGAVVAEGYTVHVFTDSSGKLVRPPAFILEAVGPARSAE